MSTERDYLHTQVLKLSSHLEKRLNVLESTTKSSKSEMLRGKLAAKKAVLAEKYMRVAETKRRVADGLKRREALKAAT